MNLNSIQIQALELAARFESSIWNSLVKSRDTIQLTEYQQAVIQSYKNFGYIPYRPDRIWYESYIGSLTSASQDDDRTRSQQTRPDEVMQYDEGYQDQYSWQYSGYTDQSLPNATSTYFYR